MNVFDIIGPVMIGPSSSHTAGAVRIGRVARAVLGEEPVRVLLRLHGSFARTYKGHGTDKALVGGLLGFDTDDIRIRDSLDLAREKGIDVKIETVSLRDAHPNTALIQAESVSGRIVTVEGASVGGGNIRIKQINGMKVELTGEYHTLLVSMRDMPGMVAAVTSILAGENINIAKMNLSRSTRYGDALMILEVDQHLNGKVVSRLAALQYVNDVSLLEPIR